MNIIIDFDECFITRIKSIRASIKIGMTKHAILLPLKDKPFYISDDLFLKIMIKHSKIKLENYLSEKINPIP